MTKIVYILGPVMTESYFGGVATFDIELAKGFRKNGWKVKNFSTQKNFSNNDRVIHLTRRKLIKSISEDSPELIISSLEYGLYFVGLKTDARKLYVLHGFFNRSNYGLWRSIIYTTLQKIMIKYADSVMANSYFTRMVNDNFFGIKADFVQHLGISDNFAEKLSSTDGIIKKKHSFIFVGRLVRAKGIESLIKAAIILKREKVHYSLKIVGDGPLKLWVKKQRKIHNLPIEFTGKKTQIELIKEYATSECFISLNPSEPFGIVFMEAIINRCKIICPTTGGQIETLASFKNSTTYVDESSPASIARGMILAINQLEQPNINERIVEEWNYKNVARKIINKTKG